MAENDSHSDKTMIKVNMPGIVLSIPDVLSHSISIKTYKINAFIIPSLQKSKQS